MKVLFDGFDRYAFPEGIKSVAAGYGSEVLLIIGSEKTALVDCGTAHCAEKMIKNLKRELDGKKLDYLLLSHSHYDHIGAMPFLKEAWPELKTFGAAYAQKVLSNQRAIDTINSLSQDAAKTYEGITELKIPEGGFSVDEVVGDGDKISLGKETITVIETKGHTDCSISFGLNLLSRFLVGSLIFSP